MQAYGKLPSVSVPGRKWLNILEGQLDELSQAISSWPIKGNPEVNNEWQMDLVSSSGLSRHDSQGRESKLNWPEISGEGGGRLGASNWASKFRTAVEGSGSGIVVWAGSVNSILHI